jgi:ribose-phosphate pyrophosphokinase
MKSLIIFGINGATEYTKSVGHHIDLHISEHTEQQFSDGENYIKSNVNVRGSDIYIISDLYSDNELSINDKFMNLILFIGSLKDASATRVTAIIKYLGYFRQDRKTESRAPITTKYLARVFESVGLDRLLTIDVHNLAAFQNSFRIPADNLDPIRLFTDYLCGGTGYDGMPIADCLPDALTTSLDNSDLVVMSPDIGGMPRCGQIQTALSKRLGIEIPLAIFDKRRVKKENSTVSELLGGRIIGNVENKRVIIYDDMISTGSTIVKAAKAVVQAGGKVFAVCATHGLFIGNADENLSDIDRIIVSDTVPSWRLDPIKWKNKLFIVKTSRLVAQSIRRTHEEGGSISDLLKV